MVRLKPSFSLDKKTTGLNNCKECGLLFEGMALIFLMVLYLTILNITNETLEFSQDRTSIIFLVWTISPLLFVYLLLRVLWIPLFVALFLICSLLIVLMSINSEKMALTGEPISWTDITTSDNIIFSLHYANIHPITALIFLCIVLVLLFKIAPLVKTSKTHYLVMATAFCIVSIFTFTPYLLEVKSDNLVLKEIEKFSTDIGINYESWDWPDNFRKQGLPMHIVQTSMRKTVGKASSHERELFFNEKNGNENLINSVFGKKFQGNIIFILCESCWYDDDHFKDAFSPLLNQGFNEFRAISPVYGGGTANAEFEMLTGLPSAGKALSGIIYAEYSNLLRSNVYTLASALKHHGYETFAAHNNYKTFWNREMVFKKFGFDIFQGIDSMGAIPEYMLKNKQPWEIQHDDVRLYNSALSELRNRADKKIFMHLITMSTHGPYGREKHLVAERYHYILRSAIERMGDFVSQVQKIAPNTLIVIYGDHKPSLNRYFYSQGILPASIFDETRDGENGPYFIRNVNPAQYGDVPILIKSNDNARIANVIKEGDGLPFFCIAGVIDRNFIHSGLVSFSYLSRNGCDKNLNLNYTGMVNNAPDWLYSLSLFE